MKRLSGLLRPGAAFLLLAGAMVGGAAAAVLQPKSMEAFDQAVLKLSAECPTQAATECVDTAWRAADADGDGTLNARELEAVRQQVDRWTATRRKELPPHTVNAISNGSRVIAAIGVGRLLGAFDANGDGQLTRSEAFSDIRLDDRPLSRVLADPEAVDRQSLSRRLATVSPLIGALIAAAPLGRPASD